jgi:hypothetical protein
MFPYLLLRLHCSLSLSLKSAGAKQGVNVTEAFETLARKIRDSKQPSKEIKNDKKTGCTIM